MCIICNLRDPQHDIHTAEDFLTAYRKSQDAMEAATKAMLGVTKLNLSPENRKRYDRAHKQMKRVMREWNMIEHTRETSAPHTPETSPTPAAASPPTASATDRL